MGSKIYLLADEQDKDRYGPAADDSRAVQVAVTPQGRLLFHAARQRRVDEVSDLLAGLTGPELRQLEDTARILQRVLGTA